jgi:hypothetical protein
MATIAAANIYRFQNSTSRLPVQVQVTQSRRFAFSTLLCLLSKPAKVASSGVLSLSLDDEEGMSPEIESNLFKACSKETSGRDNMRQLGTLLLFECVTS